MSGDVLNLKEEALAKACCAEPVALARATASGPPSTPRAFFLRGDAERPPLMADSFDGVICECSMSLFADKPSAVAQAVRVLKPGGRLGLSDMTAEPGALPQELQGYIGQVLCLAQALTVSGYVEVLERGGLTVTHRENASGGLVRILDDVEAKLGALAAWQDIAPQQGLDPGIEPGMLNEAPQLIQRLRGLVDEGRLGYWLFTARKP
jgi:SAM-dependent methyltransferase